MHAECKYCKYQGGEVGCSKVLSIITKFGQGQRPPFGLDIFVHHPLLKLIFVFHLYLSVLFVCTFVLLLLFTLSSASYAVSSTLHSIILFLYSSLSFRIDLRQNY